MGQKNSSCSSKDIPQGIVPKADTLYVYMGKVDPTTGRTDDTKAVLRKIARTYLPEDNYLART